MKNFTIKKQKPVRDQVSDQVDAQVSAQVRDQTVKEKV